MDLRQVAEVVKSTVTMDDVLNLYGYSTDRSGFMRCPFHADKTASFRAHSGRKGWYCYGCHRGGSVIDFVMEHDGCDFGTALRTLDAGMGLRLIEDDDPMEDGRRRDYIACLDGLESILMGVIRDREREIEARLRILTRRSMSLEGNCQKTASEWTEMYNIREEMMYLEDTKNRVSGRREEVREWRRKHLSAAR